MALTALKGRSETRFFVPEKGWDIHHVIIKNVMTRARSGAQLRHFPAGELRGLQQHIVAQISGGLQKLRQNAQHLAAQQRKGAEPEADAGNESFQAL